MKVKLFVKSEESKKKVLWASDISRHRGANKDYRGFVKIGDCKVYALNKIAETLNVTR